MASNFDLAAVLFVYGPIPLGKGYGAEGSIKASRTKEKYGYREGAAGEGVFWKMGSKVWILEVSCLYGSSTARILAAISAADDVANGLSLLPFVLQDPNGTFTLAGSTARITKLPDFDAASGEPKDLVYTITAVADIEIAS